MEPRNQVFITELLRKRKDLQFANKFKDCEKFEIILKKLHAMGVDINEEVIVTDDTSLQGIDKKVKYIFIAGISCDNKAENYVHHLWCFAKTGVPIILVSDEDALCDFISNDFEENEKKISKINFQCLKSVDFRKECKFKAKYCENKRIVEEFKNLTQNLTILFGEFPELMRTKTVPIFTFSFFVDFLLWQKLMGETLFSKRVELYGKKLEDQKNDVAAKSLAL